MTAPNTFRYPDYNQSLGVESPVFNSEWDAMMERRRQLVEEITSRLSLANQVGSLEAADVAANVHQIQGQNEDGTPTRFQQMMQEPNQQEINQLLGAAEYYGIANADKIPPVRLRYLVEQRRLATQHETAEARERAGVGRKIGETIAEGVVSVGLGVTQDLLSVAQRLPFVGDAISRLKVVQEADQYMALSSEHIIAGMSPDEASGFRTAKTIGGMVGYAVPATAAWKIAGAAGRIGFVANAGRIMRLGPMARTAIQGAAAAEMIEGGGDKSLQEHLMIAGLGAGTAVAFGYLEGAVPRIWERVRSGFRAKSDPFYGNEGYKRPETVDAEWSFVADNPEPIQGGPAMRQLAAGQPTAVGPTRTGFERTPTDIPGQPPAQRVGIEEVSTPDPSLRVAQLQLGQPEQPAGLLMSPERAALQERINSLVEQRDVARRLMETDPLTGGGNKQALQRAQGAVDADPELGWVVFDGKQFKSVNDNFGHQAGDQTLANFGRAIQQAAFEMGLPARFFRQGGDEFAAIVPKAQMETFAARASYLSQQTLRSQAGTVVQTRLDSYAADTFADADLKLMQNKRQARSREPYHPDDIRSIAESAALFERAYPTQPMMEVGFDSRTGKLYEFDSATAATEAATLSKQAVLTEAGDSRVLAGSTEITNADVVQASLAKAPGAISIIRGIGDASKTVRQLVQGQQSQRLMPHTFRFVKRGEGLDLLVSDGLPITNKRVAQYEKHGFFEGQTAIVNGQNVVIKNPGSEFTEVVLRNDPSLKMLVPTAGVLPEGATAPELSIETLAPKASDLYDGFQAYVMTQMDAGARAMGLDIMAPDSPARWDWLSHETSTQLPRLLDEYFDFKKITAPAVRNAIEAYFNVRRVADYRALVPNEAAELRAVIKELDGAAIAKPPVAVPVEEIAASKGFAYVPTPEQYGGTLVDRLSDLRVPVDSPEAAFEFLRGFQREVPDYTTLDSVPLELGDAGPHAANPGDDLAPVFEGGEEQVYSISVRQLNRTERAVEAALHPREPVPPSGGAPPPPPPPPTPPSLGASDSPQLPRGSRSLGRAFEETRKARPTELYQVLQELDSAWLRYGEPFRRVTLRVQDALQGIGIEEGELWKHYSDLVTAVGQKHNAEHPWMQEAADIFSNFRRRYLRDGTVTRIQEITDFNQKLDAMAKAGYTARERAGQARLADFNDRFWSMLVNSQQVDPNVSRYVHGYMSRVRMRQGMPGVTDPYADTDGMLPRELEFFAGFARESNIQLRQMDARTLTATMVRAAMFHKYAAEPWARMVQAWDDPRVPRVLREMVTDWLRVVRTGHNPEYDVMVQGIRHTLNRFGVPVTDSEVAGLWNGMFSNVYRAQLGGRPDVIFRDAISPFLAGTRIGFKPVADAYKRFLSGGAERDAMWERAFSGGWVEQGQVRSPIAEVFEGMVQTPQGEVALPGRLADRREMFARVGDAIYDLLPRFLRAGIQGTKLDPLLVYTKLNELNRLIAGDAGWTQASKALADYQFEMGRLVRGEVAPGQGSMLVDVQDRLMRKLMDESSADVYPLPIQKEFKRLVESGDIEGAANLMGNEAANSQFRYGSKEGSIGIREMGQTGRAAMTFGSFTQQYVAFMREQFGAHVPKTKRAAMATRHGTIMGILGLAGAYTGWKFSKWMWHQSVTFAGGPLATQAYELLQSTTGRAAEAMGANLSPQQSAALARSRRTSFGEDVVGALTSVFPYTSTIETANRLGTAATGSNPIEATARGIVTGEQGLGPDFRQYFENVQVRTPDDIDAAIQGNAEARGKFSAEELAFLETIRRLPREQRYRAYAGWRDSRVPSASPYQAGSPAGAGARY